MQEKNFRFKGKDGKEIFAYVWDNAEKPRGVVQIFHGMAEHAGRYADFAGFLNRNGFIVYADDHRGHGKTAGSIDELGCIGDDGFNMMVKDEHLLTGIIKEKHPGLPVYIFAHSFGSFLGQDYIERYGNEISGIILSGSAARKGPEINLGMTIAAIQRAFWGERRKSRLIHTMAFGSYNSRIKNPKSKFAWLTRDEETVKKYEDDPFCGTVFTIGFYYYMFKGLLGLYTKEKLDSIPKDLPVFLLSGDEDPVGDYGKSVKTLFEIYERLGLKNLGMKLYPGGRHEMHNETNKDEVFKDILEWLDNQRY